MNVDALRDAITAYGQHQEGCGFGPALRCTCGWLEVVRALAVGGPIPTSATRVLKLLGPLASAQLASYDSWKSRGWVMNELPHETEVRALLRDWAEMAQTDSK